MIIKLILNFETICFIFELLLIYLKQFNSNEMSKQKRFLQKYQGKSNFINSNFKRFFEQNWQKIMLLVIIILVFSYKDLTIHFDLSSPFGTNEVAPKIEETIPDIQTNQTQQGFTENIQESSRKETFSFFPSFFGGKKESEKVPQTLETTFDAIKKSKKESYIKHYAHIATQEMQQFGIPASITLAQALLHGQAGTDKLATKYNNHFSITCGSSWKNETIELQGICYRQYPSAWKSFRDHSELITSGRFADLKQYSSTDYKKWAIGLQEKGYSIDKNYANLLILIIQDFELDKQDS